MRPLIGNERSDGMRCGGPHRTLVGPQSARPCLIRGESGTGKEVVARAIHTASDRRERPFLAVNCAALSENLLESELVRPRERRVHRRRPPPPRPVRIGRRRHAAAGRNQRDRPVALQAKLLRVLQESTFERVGSSISQQVDVRVIATSNRDLEESVHEGKVPRRLVLPVERRADRTAAAAAVGWKTSARARPAFPAAQIRQARQFAPFRHIESEADSAAAKYTLGPAMCGNCRTSSSEPGVLEVRAGRCVAAPKRSNPWLTQQDPPRMASADAGRQAAGRY